MKRATVAPLRTTTRWIGTWAPSPDPTVVQLTVSSAPLTVKAAVFTSR